MSWAGPAGAMVSTPRDLALWIRALFEKRVIPETQLGEKTKLVSQKTGSPLSDATTEDPRAFGLALGRFNFKDQGGGFLRSDEGETLGFRAIFADLAAVRSPHHRCRRTASYAQRTVPAGATTGTVSVVTPTGTLNSNPQFVVTK